MNWSDISVKKYQDFFDFIYSQKDLDMENIEKLDIEKYDIYTISFFEDLPIDDIEELQINEFNNLRKKYLFARTDPPRNVSNSLNIENVDLYFLSDFFRITIGEYIDLEHFFCKDSGGFIKNLPVILSICYRQKDQLNSSFFNDKFEPYGDWIYRRSKLFEEVPINLVYGVIFKYRDFKLDFQKTFPDLLVESGPKEEFDFTGLSYRERLEAEADIAAEEARTKFGWDLFIYRLSKMNNCTFEEATKMPLLQAFGLRSMADAFKLNI